MVEVESGKVRDFISTFISLFAMLGFIELGMVGIDSEESLITFQHSFPFLTFNLLLAILGRIELGMVAIDSGGIRDPISRFVVFF